MNQNAKSHFIRPHGIGGTDIAAILGLSPYKTPLEVWSQLVGDQRIYDKDLLHLDLVNVPSRLLPANTNEPPC